ncbi:MAG: phosphatidylserine decarboxylase [Gammaproteobacteria bacterium]|nr:phosphatidylserine decarboxylase [Gammaproteobacteria bacterium]
MASYRYPLIAREAWLFIIPCVLAVLAALYFSATNLATIFIFLIFLLLFLFRDPQRKVSSSPLAVVSPVDGWVVSVESVQDEHLQREMLRVVIDMNNLGIYSIRSPMEGKVQRQWYAGATSTEQEKLQSAYAVWVQSDEEDDVLLLLHPSTLKRSPSCYLHTGERVGQGQRCGFVLFGSRVEVVLPANSRLAVKEGERVISGSSVLGQLVHKS